MDPAVIAALIQAAASIGGGVLANSGGKETKMQKTQRKLIDELLASIGGGGKYSDLFQTDEAAFQKSFVDPAMAKFKNQIAPGIQQQYVASGLQRGTGLDDSLQRAGVDLDQLINAQYMDYQQNQQGNIMNILQSILAGGAGAAPGLTTGQAFGQAVAGYAGSEGFGTSVDNILKSYEKKQPAQKAEAWSVSRPGYA